MTVYRLNTARKAVDEVSAILFLILGRLLRSTSNIIAHDPAAGHLFSVEPRKGQSIVHARALIREMGRRCGLLPSHRRWIERDGAAGREGRGTLHFARQWEDVAARPAGCVSPDAGSADVSTGPGSRQRLGVPRKIEGDAGVRAGCAVRDGRGCRRRWTQRNGIDCPLQPSETTS